MEAESNKIHVFKRSTTDFKIKTLANVMSVSSLSTTPVAPTYQRIPFTPGQVTSGVAQCLQAEKDTQQRDYDWKLAKSTVSREKGESQLREQRKGGELSAPYAFLGETGTTGTSDNRITQSRIRRRANAGTSSLPMTTTDFFSRKALGMTVDNDGIFQKKKNEERFQPGVNFGCTQNKPQGLNSSLQHQQTQPSAWAAGASRPADHISLAYVKFPPNPVALGSRQKGFQASLQPAGRLLSLDPEGKRAVTLAEKSEKNVITGRESLKLTTSLVKIHKPELSLFTKNYQPLNIVTWECNPNSGQNLLFKNTREKATSNKIDGYEKNKMTNRVRYDIISGRVLN